MLESFGKFIDGTVRPIVTLGFAGTIIYMAVIQGNHDAVIVTTTTAVLVIGFWFKDRNLDKAADVAAAVAKVAAVKPVEE